MVHFRLDWMWSFSHAGSLVLYSVTGRPIPVWKNVVIKGSVHDRQPTILEWFWSPYSDVAHVRHECEARLCSIKCQLCKRLCSNQDHMHGLEAGAIHLCGWVLFLYVLFDLIGWAARSTRVLPFALHLEYVKSRRRRIPSKPPSQVDTTRFNTRRWVTLTCLLFYSPILSSTRKVRCTNAYALCTNSRKVAKRLQCAKSIPPGEMGHEGPHTHSHDKKVVHFCEQRPVQFFWRYFSLCEYLGVNIATISAHCPWVC